MTLKNSLDHQPVELAFGTSGLRGLVNDMTDLECYINTLGFLRYLKRFDDLKDGGDILIAGDLRDSTPRIMRAVTAAIIDSGHKPINCGLVPTPTAALLGYVQNKPCIIVTGSHIPADRNGIKYHKIEGEVLKPDETDIKASVSIVRQEIYDQDNSKSIFNNDGSHKQLPDLTPETSEATELYKQRFYSFFEPNCLAEKKIIFYQHSAVGRDLLVEILKTLGAEVVPVERSDTFISIDNENVTDVEKARFRGFAKQHSDAFAIVSTDGDSDRPFVIDENGEFYRGDILGCVVAEFLDAKFAAMPISGNDAVDEFFAQKNIPLIHTKIGSPYVIAAMDEAKNIDGPKVSWEVNGGFLIGSKINLNGRILTPLPTRDAALPIICALLSAIKNNQKVSELFTALPKRYTGGGLIDNVDPQKIRRFIETCQKPDEVTRLMKTIFSGSAIGEVKSTDLTDGLRIVFESGDVLQLRPSNNAPQFRVYTNADSQDRADELAQLGIADDGYIQTVLKGL